MVDWVSTRDTGTAGARGDPDRFPLTQTAATPRRTETTPPEPPRTYGRAPLDPSLLAGDRLAEPTDATVQRGENPWAVFGQNERVLGVSRP